MSVMGVERVRAFMGRPWPDEPFVPLARLASQETRRSRPQAAWPKNVSPSSQPGLYVVEPGRKEVLLPVAGGRLEAFQLLEQSQQARPAPAAGRSRWAC